MDHDLKVVMGARILYLKICETSIRQFSDIEIATNTNTSNECIHIHNKPGSDRQLRKFHPAPILAKENTLNALYLWDSPGILFSPRRRDTRMWRMAKLSTHGMYHGLESIYGNS